MKLQCRCHVSLPVGYLLPHPPVSSLKLDSSILDSCVTSPTDPHSSYNNNVAWNCSVIIMFPSRLACLLPIPPVPLELDPCTSDNSITSPIDPHQSNDTQMRARGGSRPSTTHLDPPSHPNMNRRAIWTPTTISAITSHASSNEGWVWTTNAPPWPHILEQGVHVLGFEKGVSGLYRVLSIFLYIDVALCNVSQIIYIYILFLLVIKHGEAMPKFSIYNNLHKTSPTVKCQHEEVKDWYYVHVQQSKDHGIF